MVCRCFIDGSGAADNIQSRAEDYQKAYMLLETSVTALSGTVIDMCWAYAQDFLAHPHIYISLRDTNNTLLSCHRMANSLTFM